MKIKIPLNACITNSTTENMKTPIRSMCPIAEWNFRTEPYEMSYLMGVAGGCMAAILLLVCLCIYAIKSKRCCFKGKSVGENGPVKATTIKTSFFIMTPVFPPPCPPHRCRTNCKNTKTCQLAKPWNARWRRGQGNGGKNGCRDRCVSLPGFVSVVLAFFLFSLKLETQINLIKYSLASNACGQSPFPVSLLTQKG